MIAPLMGISVLIIHFCQFKKIKQLFKSIKDNKWVWLVVVLTGFLSLPILISMRNPEVSQRFAETSIFSNLDIIIESNQLKELAGNTFWSKIIYHRYILFAQLII